MELRLNIYKVENGVKTIEKTYTANDYEIMFGTIEDIIDALELDKINGKLALASLLEHFPIDFSLIVRDVDAMYLIAMRHTHPISLQTITRFPTIGVRTDKEPIETRYKDYHH